MFGNILSGAAVIAVIAAVQAIPAPAPFPAGRNSTTNGNPGRTVVNGNTTSTAQSESSVLLYCILGAKIHPGNGADNACARGFTQYCGLYTPTNGTLPTAGTNATNGTTVTPPANNTTTTPPTTIDPCTVDPICCDIPDLPHCMAIADGTFRK